jgi:hypothetical protein
MSKRIKKPKIFVQECGTYSNEILVLCGASKMDTFRFLKKIKAKVSFTKWVLEDFDDWNKKVSGENDGMFCYNTECAGTVLVLKPIKGDGDWKYWETLMHEVHHIVFWLSEQKAFKGETENQAYLFDHLFRNIRRKIQGVEDWRY